MTVESQRRVHPMHKNGRIELKFANMTVENARTEKCTKREETSLNGL